MFLFFKKKKLEKLLESAQQYLERALCHEDPPITEPGEQESSFSAGDIFFFDPDEALNPQIEPEREVRYSLKAVPPKAEETKDRYNEETVTTLMRNLSATSALEELILLDRTMDMSFVDKLLEHINRKQLRDTAVYKAAQIDRRLFSKIVSDRQYKPSKDTCIAFAFALRMTLEEAKDLLFRAGYSLSHSSKRDVVLEYFFRERVYNLADINEILYRLGQKILGR